MARCKHCGEPIVWGVTPRGFVPMEPVGADIDFDDPSDRSFYWIDDESSTKLAHLLPRGLERAAAEGGVRLWWQHFNGHCPKDPLQESLPANKQPPPPT